MKNEKIIEAWNTIQLKDGADARIKRKIYADTYEKKEDKYLNRFIKSAAFIPTIITLALLIIVGAGTVVYATLSSNGKLILFKANEHSEKNSDVIFILDDSVRVKMEDITGEIVECEDIIAEQIEKYDMFSSQSPYEVEKTFETIEAAINYVGYNRLTWPAIKEKIDEVKVTVFSEEKDTIQKIKLNSNYALTDEMEAHTEAIIFTDTYDGEIGTGLTSYSEWFEGVDFSSETVNENGREFYVVSSSEFENRWLVKCVYWQENNVIYTLNIRYKGVDSGKINDLVNRWMCSF